jgi:hypothetical protein
MEQSRKLKATFQFAYLQVKSMEAWMMDHQIAER